jgi:carbon storage regulator
LTVPAGYDSLIRAKFHEWGFFFRPANGRPKKLAQPNQGGVLMLVLTRKPGEEIVIGEKIRIMVVAVSAGKVRLGITAPADVVVDRLEIHQQRESRPVSAEPAKMVSVYS